MSEQRGHVLLTILGRLGRLGRLGPFQYQGRGISCGRDLKAWLEGVEKILGKKKTEESERETLWYYCYYGLIVTDSDFLGLITMDCPLVNVYSLRTGKWP